MMDGRRILKYGLQVVAILLAAFHGFLLKMSPPDEIQQWRSAYAGYAAFIVLIVFLGITFRARRNVATGTYPGKSLALAVVCGCLSGIFFFTYQARTHTLTYLFPQGAQSPDLHVKGTVLTREAEKWRSDHPGVTDSEAVGSFGGPRFAERVWTAESIERSRIELTAWYVALVVTLLSAVLFGLEGAITARDHVEPATERKKPTAGTAAMGTKTEVDSRERAGAKKHVFLSYCHDNMMEVSQLREELMAAGEAVWWDQDIKPGQDWKLEIRKAMKSAYAVVLCLSKESDARTTSGIYPEALDAINAYREYSPGSIFLIPVRLSKCEIPFLEIDCTRMLDRLQFVDLFPAEKRANGLRNMLDAIRAAPHRLRPSHPESGVTTSVSHESTASAQNETNSASAAVDIGSGSVSAEGIAGHDTISHQSGEAPAIFRRTRSKPSATIEAGPEGYSLVLKSRAEFSVLRYKVIASSGTVLYDVPNKESWVTSKGFRWIIPETILTELWNDGGPKNQQVNATIRYEVETGGEEDEFSLPIQLLPAGAQTGYQRKFVVNSIG